MTESGFRAELQPPAAAIVDSEIDAVSDVDFDEETGIVVVENSIGVDTAVDCIRHTESGDYAVRYAV